MHMVDDVGPEANPCTDEGNDGKGDQADGNQWTRNFWAEKPGGRPAQVGQWWRIER